ncbi:MAG: phosphotriesterase [Acidimicrobiales bacterium]
MTVGGPVSVSELGHVLPHEHVLSDFSPPSDTPEGWRAIGQARPQSVRAKYVYESSVGIELLGELTLGAANRDNWRLDDPKTTVSEIQDFVSHGGRTIVDLTTRGLGRDPQALRNAAEGSGAQIVMGSGWYGPAWEPERDWRATEELLDELVLELRDGADGVRPGVIGEIGAVDLDVPAAASLLRAAGGAAEQTGTSVFVDRGPSVASCRRIVSILAEAGAHPSQIALGHCDGFALDPDVLREILDDGVFVSFDLLGRLATVKTEVSDHDVALAVLELAHQGSADRVLVSSDTSKKIDLKAFGGSGYSFVMEQFVPYLKGLGADDELIEALTVSNPARYLTARPGQDGR